MNNNISNIYPGISTNFPSVPIYTNENMHQIPNQTTTKSIKFPLEQSYIENILKINKGKKVDIYITFTDSNEWRDKVFSGIIEQTGHDYIILSDPKTGAWYLLQTMYLNYIKFMEPINYNQEFLTSPQIS